MANFNQNFSLYIIFFSLYVTYLINCNEILDYSESNWPSTCKNGVRNSPIDFPNLNSTSYVVTTDYIQILSSNYSITKGNNFTFDGNHRYYLSVSGLGNLMVKKNGITYWYDLVNLHLHIISEHTFEGKAYDMEMHLVHTKNTSYLTSNNVTTDPDSVNTHLVVGILFRTTGLTINNDVQLFDIGKFGPVNGLDLNPYVNGNKSFYHYLGGLTTPNCDEIVNWVVMENIENFTKSQFDPIYNWIKEEYPDGNSRLVRPLNNRTIYYVKPNVPNNDLNFSMIIVAMAALFILFFFRKKLDIV